MLNLESYVLLCDYQQKVLMRLRKMADALIASNSVLLLSLIQVLKQVKNHCMVQITYSINQLSICKLNESTVFLFFSITG